MSDIRVLKEAGHSLVIDFEDHILLKLSFPQQLRYSRVLITLHYLHVRS